MCPAPHPTPMANLPLACSVRDCGLALERRDRALVCSAGHSFDIARSGYVNVLQPQDRRSTRAGDSKAAVEARAALERAGLGRHLVGAVIEKIVELGVRPNAVTVDLGSGSGEMLGRLSAARSIAAIGIDLSVAAIEYSARRFPSVTWVVANADRRLPLLDGSVDVVLSIHGRRNPSECARVLTPAGILFVVVPAADDLIELRAFVQGQAIERDRVDTMLRAHEMHFQLAHRVAVRERVTVDRGALGDLLRGTYRGARYKLSDRVEGLPQMEVTLSAEICVLELAKARSAARAPANATEKSG
jgi:23S rRNA (guanine745-N1)-methyltransferase